MNNNCTHKKVGTVINMFINMFITSLHPVQIYEFTHRIYQQAVAKSITVNHLTHIINTGYPQIETSSLGPDLANRAGSFFSTLSTSTTTTIFKIVERDSKYKTNNSLTFKLQTIYN